MEKQKLTETELQEYQINQQESNRLASLLGELYYQKVLIDIELEKLKETVGNHAQKQQKYLQELGEKYGNGVINPQTGEITYLPVN